MDKARSKIMIVDDNITNLTVARNLLKAHHDVYLAPSAAQMFEMLEKIHPDLILLDIEMPEMDGYEAIKKLKGIERFSQVPVIFLTAQRDEASELTGFDLGAADYVNKPFSPPLLLKRIEHQILIARQREVIQHHVDNLSVMVSEKVSEVLTLQNAILDTITDLVEFRDHFTGGHITRTQLYLKVIIDGLRGKKAYMEEMAGWDIDYILQSAQLHDVGKIGIPDSILNKPARLTPEEFEVMKTHVEVGVDAVHRILNKAKGSVFLQHALNVVGAHHEKWDGSGYPKGLRGEDIPLEGRLMAVADVYDALVSWRPYKKNYTHERASAIIAESSGTHFDPVLVEVFLATEDQFRQISAKSSEAECARWGMTIQTKSIEIGVPEVDAQHKELIDRLNKVVLMGSESNTREEAERTLDFLEDYIVRHFRYEEELQRKSAYPKYEWHKGEHDAFIRGYQKLREEFTANDFSPEFASKLHSTGINWVIHHIKAVDVEFGKYYQVRRKMRAEAGEQVA